MRYAAKLASECPPEADVIPLLEQKEWADITAESLNEGRTVIADWPCVNPQYMHANNWCVIDTERYPAGAAESDPMDRLVDGLTVRECLERYERWQREDQGNKPYTPRFAPDKKLTVGQYQAAQSAWSAELRAKQQAAREAERVEIVVDDGGWEP